MKRALTDCYYLSGSLHSCHGAVLVTSYRGCRQNFHRHCSPGVFLAHRRLKSQSKKLRIWYVNIRKLVCFMAAVIVCLSYTDLAVRLRFAHYTCHVLGNKRLIDWLCTKNCKRSQQHDGWTSVLLLWFQQWHCNRRLLRCCNLILLISCFTPTRMRITVAVKKSMRINLMKKAEQKKTNLQKTLWKKNS